MAIPQVENHRYHESEIVGAEPVHLKWSEYRRAISWELPGANVWGFHRGAYPILEAEMYCVRTIRVPVGQKSPVAADSVNRIVVHLSGEVEFYANSKTFALEPYDFLKIPAGTNYQYMNVELEDALFFDVTGKAVFSQSPESRSELDKEPAVLKWKEYRRTLKWPMPDSDIWGFHRGSCERMSTSDFSLDTIIQPAGQTAPRHGKPWDCMFLQLRGETTFDAGPGSYSLQAGDILFVPSGNPYRYTNIGSSPALFISIEGTRPPGAKAKYYDLQPR